MSYFKFIFFVAGLVVGPSALAATYYVGVGAQCNAPNHHESLSEALLAAAINGTENDEIRLTNTVSYLGEGDGTNTLSNWHSSSLGELIIAGGYANCGDSVNAANAVLGDGSSAVFEVNSGSMVTLRNLQLFNSQSRGLIVDENSTVNLEAVDVSSNVAGIRVLGGSNVTIDAGSIVQNNGDLNNIPKGGGIWCFGVNSQVIIAGALEQNQAVSGGNMYIEDGCFVLLEGGSRIKGSRGLFEYSADDGGGIMVHDGGELVADGGANRVQITDHWAFNGSGIYVHGTGRATLFNTYIARNMADVSGAGLFAIDGGNSATQVYMDRVASCPFLISCSEFEQNEFDGNLIEINNSKVNINRTLFDSNSYRFGSLDINSLVEVRPGSTLQLSGSNFIKNETYYLIQNYGTSEITHVTAAGNFLEESGGGTNDSIVWFSTMGSLRFENSIFQDTQGGENAPTTTPDISGKCNLIDDSTDWPMGSYTIGTAVFNNVAGGDARQQSSSPGVDMCLQDTFAWSVDVDIEFQDSPVNENTNPQGNPGEPGGLYDAGFDEVYDNIGNDEFLLTVQREGSGDGFVISDPLGISCGTDCTEVFFNGTLVTLTATPFTGSDFIGWRGCPLVNNNECFISVTESTTVYAEFQPDDLIFSDGFD
ncbi:InlB B-repeat-containing protein [Marinicella litoralis]|uniref:Bacterial repeat domain-containing protein n=1 Tax=Marinicella litoralis TaxID=644220 RepID=A0A4R6XYA6_9GAMM|nr:hypothetical protein [Marinicella litoralis]TDR22713.1 hypothetical protein C8D91_1206 [Marinicella litoralis]